MSLGLPLPPSDVTVITDDFTTENVSILLSWTNSQRADNYTISLNTTTDIVTTDMTMYSLYQVGAYNLPLQVLSAINCAGTSSEVIRIVHKGRAAVYMLLYPCNLYYYAPLLASVEEYIYKMLINYCSN